MIKRCPVCKSEELESEECTAPKKDGSLTDAIAYLCIYCGAEFYGIRGKGLIIQHNPKKEDA